MESLNNNPELILNIQKPYYDPESKEIACYFTITQDMESGQYIIELATVTQTITPTRIFISDRKRDTVLVAIESCLRDKGVRFLK